MFVELRKQFPGVNLVNVSFSFYAFLGSPAQGVKENGLSKDSNEVSLPASAPVSTPAMSNGNGDESPLPSDEQPTHSPPSNQNHSRNEDVIDSKDVRPSPKNNDKSVDGWGRRLSSINKEGSMGASAGDSTTDKVSWIVNFCGGCCKDDLFVCLCICILPSK